MYNMKVVSFFKAFYCILQSILLHFGLTETKVLLFWKPEAMLDFLIAKQAIASCHCIFSHLGSRLFPSHWVSTWDAQLENFLQFLWFSCFCISHSDQGCCWMKWWSSWRKIQPIAYFYWRSSLYGFFAESHPRTWVTGSSTCRALALSGDLNTFELKLSILAEVKLWSLFEVWTWRSICLWA